MFKAEKEQANELVLLMYYVLILGAMLAVVLALFDISVFINAPVNVF